MATCTRVLILLSGERTCARSARVCLAIQCFGYVSPVTRINGLSNCQSPSSWYAAHGVAAELEPRAKSWLQGPISTISSSCMHTIVFNDIHSISSYGNKRSIPSGPSRLVITSQVLRYHCICSYGCRSHHGSCQNAPARPRV
jgi:hypothetical protein